MLPSSLFPCFSVTKGVVAATIHAALDALAALEGGGGDEGGGKGVAVSYETRVEELWPAFVSQARAAAQAPGAPPGALALAEAKATTTLRHVLTHTSGLQHALPAQASVAVLSDLSAGMDAVERALPLWVPGTSASYHYLAFGWIAAGVLRGMQARLVSRDAGWAAWEAQRAPDAPPFSVGRLMQRLVAARLGREDEMHIGVPRALVAERPGRLAELCVAPPATPVPAAEAAAPPFSASAAAPSAEVTAATAAAAAATAAVERLKVLLMGETPRGSPQGSPSESPRAEAGGGVAGAAAAVPACVSAATAATAAPASFRRTDAAALRSVLADLATSAPHVFDPRTYNERAMREGEIPAANGHFSARALAHCYHSLGVGGGLLVSASRVTAASRPRAAELEPEHELELGWRRPRSCSWGLGMQVWAVGGADGGGGGGCGSPGGLGGGGGTDTGGAGAAFGHAGAGGSLAFFCSRSRSGVAIVLNLLSTDKTATRAILGFLERELGVTNTLSF